MLTEKTRAIMTNRLQVPAVIDDLLSGQEKLTEEMEFTLHDMITDMQPDTALLCISTCVQKITHSYILASAAMQVMHAESERIIEDYADLWVQNALDKDVDEIMALDALSTITEDLECLADLLALNVQFLKAKDETSAKLFEILRIQATSHQMIADEFFAAISLALGTGARGPVMSKIPQHEISHSAIMHAHQNGANTENGPALFTEHNVIPFPDRRSV